MANGNNLSNPVQFGGFVKIKSYTISPDGVKGFCKRPVILGSNGINGLPLCYLQKPKWMSDEQFRIVVHGIKLNLPSNIEWIIEGESK